MKNIQSSSRILYVLFVLLFWLTPAFYAAYWFDPNHILSSIGWNLAGLPNANLPALTELSWPVRFAAWIASLLPMMANLFTWYFLIQLFSAYRQGVIFSRQNAKTIRNIGLTLFIWEIITIPYQILLTFIMTSMQPAGKHMIAISYSNHDLSTLLTAIIIIVIGQIMQRGAVLAEEQSLTV